MPTNHDFDAQRNESLWVWNDLAGKTDLPKCAALDLHFVPKNGSADWDAFQLDLADAGYRCKRYDDGGTLEASVGPIDLSFDVIWRHEFATTSIALARGFLPDGWGFLHG